MFHFMLLDLQIYEGLSYYCVMAGFILYSFIDVE